MTTIVLIHGAWLTPLCWKAVRARYESKGYTCLAPAWPFDDRTVPELRAAPHPELATLTVERIVAHYETIVRSLREPPILMGHSFGGLFVQMLLDRGLGSAGVAIDPLTPRGVLPGWLTVRSSAPALLRWGSWDRLAEMSFETFATNFAQTLPDAEKRAAYDEYIVPTPGRIFWQGAMGVPVAFGNAARAPLLLIAGEADRTIQPSMVEAAYRKHARSPAATSFKAFAGRSHWLMLEPGWEEVADYALTWAREHARRDVSETDAARAAAQ